MTLNQLFQTFFYYLDFLHILIDEYLKKSKYVRFKYFFCDEKKRVILWALEEYPSRIFTLQKQISWEKFPITLSEKWLGLLGIGSMFKTKFAIGESPKALKKLAAKKVGSKKKLWLKNDINQT
jgi:hypothetical protein